jgi:hypothetical protein
MKWHQTAAAALLLSALSTGASASCGAAFCSVNTSWDFQSGLAGPGASFDLRYEAITQDQPRNGSRKVAVGEIPRHHDEVSTRNRNWLGTYDHVFNADWALSVAAPFVDREHLHIHNHVGQQEPESWKFSALGDVRVLARYRLSSPESRDPPTLGATGITFGLKLPTGSIGKRNADGELAERTLQPGTGTTDALIGAYLVRVLPLKDLSWFAQAQLQLPMDARDGYRPGKRASVDAGLRYDLTGDLSLLLQANLLLRGRDAGVNAEPGDSGGKSLFLSPGLGYAVTRDLRVYGFLQLPLYQYVNGVQLTASKAAVAGLSARF